MFQKCPNCSTRMIKGSKYCTNCGAKFPHDSEKNRRKVNKKFMKIDFTDGTRLLNRYKNYFIDRIVDPTTSMKRSMQKESFQFGVFQLIVIALINGLTLLTLSRKTDSLNYSMFTVFLGSSVLHIILFLNTALSLYIAINYMKKVPTTAQTIISRIGGFASPLLILSFFLYLSAFSGLSLFSYYIGIYGFILVGIAIINFYLLSIKNQSSIPNFYILVIAMGMFLLLHITTSTFLLRYSTNPQIYSDVIRLIFR